MLSAILIAVWLVWPSAAADAQEVTKDAAATQAEQLFLDRLMQAESGGRLFAKNPASSALGPFQFIGSTFLDVVLRYFPEVTEGKSDAEILALRVDAKIARDADTFTCRAAVLAVATSLLQPSPIACSWRTLDVRSRPAGSLSDPPMSWVTFLTPCLRAGKRKVSCGGSQRS